MKKFIEKHNKLCEIILKIILTLILLILIFPLFEYLMAGYINKDEAIIGAVWVLTTVSAVSTFVDDIFPKGKSEESELLEEIKAELQNINSRMILVKVDEVKEETRNS